MTEDIVRALLESGGDPDILAVEGPHRSALIVPCVKCDIDVFRHLLTLGADVDQKVKCGGYSSALMAAARSMGVSKLWIPYSRRALLANHTRPRPWNRGS